MIAYVMLYTVVAGIPIFAAAWSVAAVLRSYGRPERPVWLGALLLSFAIPGLALAQSLGPGAAAAAPAGGGVPTGVIGLPAVVVVPPGPGGAGLGALLVTLWISASLLLAVRLAASAMRLARASRSWSHDTMDGVPILLTDEVGPAVSGIVRPRVLVPRWLARMPADRRSLVLLHEQEHVRARDPWLMLVSRVAPVLAPWNPVVWLISARLLRAIELDCDRRVLRHRPDVRAYGSTLIEISSRDRGRLVAVAAFAESEAPLRSRILNMTTPPRTVSILALLASMVFGVVLMFAAFEIPVPTIRAHFELGPEPADAAVVDGRTDRAERERQDREETGAAEDVGPDADGRASAAAGPDPVRGRPTEAPPSAEEELRRIRAQSGFLPGGSESGVEPTPPARPDGDLAQRPTFTPFTQPPRLLNLREVQQALMREYPTVVRDSGIGGTVTVWFFIDADGRVAQTRLDLSSGYPALDDAAIDVASVYRFSPALNRDERVPVWVSLPITFQVR